jgi:hypothetical protein
MLGLYYRIWVDCITKARSRPENSDSWIVGTMIFMSVSMTLNLLLGMTAFEKYYLGFYFYDIKLKFLPKDLSSVVSFAILYALPCVLMNYFLIFYKDRYKELLIKYPSSNGKLFLPYFLVSMLLPLVLLFGGMILNRMGIIS